MRIGLFSRSLNNLLPYAVCLYIAVQHTNAHTKPSGRRINRIKMKKIPIILLAILAILTALMYRPDLPAEEVRARYGSDPASRFTGVMGMQVHYRDEGLRDDSIPLVLVHGLSSSLHTWDSIVPLLSGKERIIRMDLPGFGLTGADPRQTYSLENYDRFLDSFLTKLGVEKYIMAGNSLGGAISWNQSLAYPEKVRGLILINAAGYPRKDEKGSIGFKLAGTPVIGDLLTKLTPRILIKKSLENVYYDHSRITPALTDRYHDLLRREGNRQALLRFFKARKQADPKRIPEISVPTLIIWGRHDRLISVDNAQAFHKDIRGSRMVIFEDAGHVPMEERPGETLDAMMPFLQEFRKQP